MDDPAAHGPADPRAASRRDDHAAHRQGALHRRSGRLHRRHRPLLAEDAAELIAVEYEELAAVTDMTRALPRSSRWWTSRLPSNLISHQTFSAGDPARRFAEAYRSSSRRVSPAPPDARADRDARRLAQWDEGRRTSPCTSATRCRTPTAPARAPAAPERVAGDRRLARYRRRLRPEDRALPRGAHRGGAVARAQAPGALARGPQREPAGILPCARGLGAHARRRRHRGAHPRPRA